MTPPNAPPAEPTGASRWEAEGGSRAAHGSDALPNGMIANLVTHYQVGPYSYTNLDDALAEHRRQMPK